MALRCQLDASRSPIGATVTPREATEWHACLVLLTRYETAIASLLELWDDGRFEDADLCVAVNHLRALL